MSLEKLIAFTTTVLIIWSSLAESRTYKPINSEDLRSAIESSKAGDVIQLGALDYEGDFFIEKSGNSYQEIKLIG